MTDLEEKLNDILDEKETKIIPENIKKDVTILGVTGTYEGSGGGGGTGGVKDVIFIDYDGTEVASYSKNDFLNLSALPSNPTHTGLTSQGWNWTLADAKSHVNLYDKLIIGQNYTTTSGVTEIDVGVNSDTSTNLYVTINMSGTKDWGDGTSDTEITHQYATAGNYTITCNGNMIDDTNGFCKQTYYNANNYTLHNIRLANNVTFLPENCFRTCHSLATVTIPSSVTTIKARAFYDAKALRGAVIPSGVTTLNADAFNYANTIESIALPKSLTEITGFCYCYNLKNITIPMNVASISTYCFRECANIKEIIIPSGVTTLGNSTFLKCYGLSKIKMHNNITSLGQNLFDYCYGLSEIILPNNIDSIPGTFSRYVYGLKEISIPSSVTGISGSAFAYCYSLDKIDFSTATAVPSLGNVNAFMNINKCCKIIVPDNLYTTWIAANTWSSVANYIVKASEA